MAQACVMIPQKPVDAVLTPVKAPEAAHLDSSLITSAIRKRKVEQQGPQQTEGEKKARTVAGYGLAGALQALQQQRAPAAPPPQPNDRQAEAEAEAKGAGTEGGHGQQADAEVHIFSPVFHASHGGGAAEEADAEGAGACSRAQAPCVESSTDLSTSTDCGTSGGSAEDTGGSSQGCGGGGASAGVASAAAATSVPTSPLPPQARAVAVTSSEAAAECEDEDDGYLDFDPFLFIKRLPPVHLCIPPRQHFLLPRQTRHSKRKTLVLDLDETLVHSTLDGYVRSDFVFPVVVGSARHMVSVRQRPHLHTFLARVASLFEVVVFTASQRVYAEQLLDLVDPGKSLIRHRVFRESCVLWEGNYLKDLTVLGRDLSQTIIVDNSPQAFGFQLDNGIPIESWYDDETDQELLRLLPFLEQVASADDVRPHIASRFRLRQLVDSSSEPKQGPGTLLLC